MEEPAAPPARGESGSGGREVVVLTTDNRPPFARQVSSSVSVRVNAVDDTVDLFRVNTVSYILLTCVNLSLIIAGVAVLALHWGEEDVCDTGWRNGWRWWVLTMTLRKVLTTPAHMVRWRLSLQPQEARHAALDSRSECFLKWMEYIAFIYFIYGHVYLFQSRSCDNKFDWPVFQLAVAILVIKWMRYFLPCMIACVLIPASYCCMPCIVRVLSWLYAQQEPSAGAQQAEIDTIPKVKFSEMESMTEESCCICLVDYEAGDSLRKLPCGHAFHVSCADSWLAMNATCPVCRAPCFQEAGGGAGAGASNTGVAPTTSGTNGMSTTSPLPGSPTVSALQMTRSPTTDALPMRRSPTVSALQMTRSPTTDALQRMAERTADEEV